MYIFQENINTDYSLYDDELYWEYLMDEAKRQIAQETNAGFLQEQEDEPIKII